MICDSATDCNAVVMTYQPGVVDAQLRSVGASDSTLAAAYGSPSDKAPRYGTYQCGFTSCTHTQNWNGEAYVALPALAVLLNSLRLVILFNIYVPLIVCLPLDILISAFFSRALQKAHH